MRLYVRSMRHPFTLIDGEKHVTSVDPVGRLVHRLMGADVHLEPGEAFVVEGTLRKLVETDGPVKWELPVKGDFLNMFVNGPERYTQLYVGLAEQERRRIRLRTRSLDYNVVNLCPLNWPGEGNLGDYTRQGQLGKYQKFDHYGRYTSVSAAAGARAFVVFLEEILRDGLTPLPWLRLDDHRGFDQTARAFLKRVWPEWLEIVNPYAKQLVVALEMDEYWREPDQQAMMVRAVLNATTGDTDVILHWTKGSDRLGVWSGDMNDPEDWYLNHFSPLERRRLVAAVQISDELGNDESASKDIVVARIAGISRKLKPLDVRVLLGELGLVPRPGWGKACEAVATNAIGSLAGW